MLFCTGQRCCTNQCTDEHVDDEDDHTESDLSDGLQEAFDHTVRKLDREMHHRSFEPVAVAALRPATGNSSLHYVGMEVVDSLRQTAQPSVPNLGATAEYTASAYGRQDSQLANYTSSSSQPLHSTLSRSTTSATRALYGNSSDDCSHHKTDQPLHWSPEKAAKICATPERRKRGCSREDSKYRQALGCCQDNHSRESGEASGLAADIHESQQKEQHFEHMRRATLQIGGAECVHMPLQTNFAAKQYLAEAASSHGATSASSRGATSTDGTRTPASHDLDVAAYGRDRSTRSLSASDRRRLKQMMREQLNEAKCVDQTVAQALKEVDRRLT